MIRVGQGYDLHRLVEGRELILAGVRIPHTHGLDGHSDADVLTHAVIDALLGAVALGDIGRHFPDSDPQYKDADSMELLRVTAALIREKGWHIGNVDATVIAQAPKLAPHIEAMSRNLSGVLGTDIEAVSIKAKTNEGVDATGRGEAIAAHAVVLLHFAK